MVLGLRIVGWFIFAAGLTVFLANGGLANVRTTVSMFGVILMPVGMIFTSAATILQWRRNYQRTEARMRGLPDPYAPPEPEAPPALPPGPEKHYGARKLDPGKIKKNPEQQQ